MIFIGCAIAGILLGLRFKIFVLVPACLLATAIVIPSGHGPRATALMVFVAVVLIQIGYIAGSVLRVLATRQLQVWRSARFSRNGPERHTELGRLSVWTATNEAYFAFQRWTSRRAKR
jgi:hypothetical protein